MRYRCKIPVSNKLGTDLRVVVEPWGNEMVLPPRGRGEVVVTGPTECPAFSVTLSDYGFVVYVEGDSDGFELWQAGEMISSC